MDVVRGDDREEKWAASIRDENWRRARNGLGRDKKHSQTVLGQT
jgi:hypothetical protein